MDSSRRSSTQFIPVACATLGIVATLSSLSSCSLLNYEGGSLGLYKYSYDGSNRCIPFENGLDDGGIQMARLASVAAVGCGSCLFMWNVTQLLLPKIPHGDIITMLLGAVTQLCLALVYVARENGVCETFGCTWGLSALWNLLAHVTFLGASSTDIWGILSKNCPERRRRRKKRRMMMP